MSWRIEAQFPAHVTVQAVHGGIAGSSPQGTRDPFGQSVGESPDVPAESIVVPRRQDTSRRACRLGWLHPLSLSRYLWDCMAKGIGPAGRSEVLLFYCSKS